MSNEDGRAGVQDGAAARRDFKLESERPTTTMTATTMALPSEVGRCPNSAARAAVSGGGSPIRRPVGDRCLSRAIVVGHADDWLRGRQIKRGGGALVARLKRAASSWWPWARAGGEPGESISAGARPTRLKF